MKILVNAFYTPYRDSLNNRNMQLLRSETLTLKWTERGSHSKGGNALAAKDLKDTDCLYLTFSNRNIS